MLVGLAAASARGAHRSGAALAPDDVQSHLEKQSQRDHRSIAAAGLRSVGSVDRRITGGYTTHMGAYTRTTDLQTGIFRHKS